jgi:hypothetical protein
MRQFSTYLLRKAAVFYRLAGRKSSVCARLPDAEEQNRRQTAAPRALPVPPGSSSRTRNKTSEKGTDLFFSA